MNKSVLLPAAIMALSLSACASITTGTTQNVTIDSIPSGAQCQLSNDKGSWMIKQTPESTVIHRAYSDLTVTCQKDKLTGMQSFKSTTKGVAFGNILAGGVIGAAVDMGNGSAYDYPANITIRMGDNTAAATTTAPVVTAAEK